MTAFCDASWADIPGGIGGHRVMEGRRSTLGHVILMNGGVVQYKSQVSKTVALSSAEAELYSCVACAKDITHGRRLCDLVGHPQAPTPTTMFSDSSAAISINTTRSSSSRMRHTEIKYFYCRELVTNGIIAMRKVAGEQNPSDLLTKALPAPKFRRFAAQLVTSAIAKVVQTATRAVGAVYGWSWD